MMIGASSDGGIGREAMAPRFEDDEDLEAERLRRAELREIEADRRHDAEAVERS